MKIDEIIEAARKTKEIICNYDNGKECKFYGTEFCREACGFRLLRQALDDLEVEP